MSTALHELASREGHAVLSERADYGLGAAIRVRTRSGRERVLKLLAASGRDGEASERWCALSAFAPPAGVARVDARGACDAGLWCLLEDVPHPSIARWSRETSRVGAPLDVALVRGVIESVAAVVARLHRQRPPRAHGALHPASVLLALDRHQHHDVTLLDVGVAEALRGRCVAPEGDADARAPDVVAGDAPEVSDDVFGLAALAAHLLGVHARAALPARWSDLAASTARARASALLAARPSLEPALAEVLARALDADRARRPGSVEELRRLLAAVPRWEREVAVAPRRAPRPEAVRLETGVPARRALPSAMRFGVSADETMLDPNPPSMDLPAESDEGHPADRTILQDGPPEAAACDETLPLSAAVGAFGARAEPVARRASAAPAAIDGTLWGTSVDPFEGLEALTPPRAGINQPMPPPLNRGRATPMGASAAWVALVVAGLAALALAVAAVIW